MSRTQMILRWMIFNAAAIGLVMLLQCGGCAASGGEGSQAPTASSSGRTTAPAVAQSAEESEFVAGDHRPPTAKTLFSMARILEIQGKDSEAEYVLRSVLRMNPKFMPAYCDLAEAMLRQRRVDEAIHTLNLGLARSPNDAVLMNDLGMCQLLRNNSDGALEFFTRAAALCPDDARYRSNMAVALGMAGRYSESLALYRQVVPEADAHYNLGVLCEERHDKTRAAAEFQEAQAARVSSATRDTGSAGDTLRGDNAAPAPSAAVSTTAKPNG